MSPLVTDNRLFVSWSPSGEHGMNMESQLCLRDEDLHRLRRML